MKSGFNIVPTRDAELIGSLAARIWPGVYGNILTPEQLSYMMGMMYAPAVLRREMDAEGIRFHLACENGNPAGFSSFGPYAEAEAEAKLHKLYLLESARGKGYGRRMLDFVAAEARLAGYEFLRLNVNRHNTGSVAVYLACGFTRYESVDVPIGDGFFMNDYIMRKSL